MIQPHDEMPDPENGWRECKTLGSKEKLFCWKIDKEGSIWIKRQFKSKAHPSGEITINKSITQQELFTIHHYLQMHPGTHLANNVEKLRLSEEEEGLGKFMYEHFGWSTTDAQLASHIAAIFVRSGAWIKDSPIRGFKLEANAKFWRPCVEGYYYGTAICKKTE